MKKFVINVLAALAATFAIGSIATPAAAQDVDTTCTTCGDVPDTTLRGTSITVQAGAGNAGDFRAMWNGGEGGTGSATVAKEGGSYSVFGITYDSCNTGECGVARVTADVGGYEAGQSEATATATRPGQWAVAQNSGLAQTAGVLNVTIRTPTSTHTQNGQ